jgi:TIR domain
MRRKIKLFVSYAHGNQLLARQFIEKLTDVLSPSKANEYELWMDSMIVVGEDWKKQIVNARNNCDFGLLLISPAFLASKFIVEEELSYFVIEDKCQSIPIMLVEVDLERHNLRGLESKQIFRLSGERFSKPRDYSSCKSKARSDFILALFRAIEDKLAAKNAV